MYLLFYTGSISCVKIVYLPYGGKLWVQTLAQWQRKHCWLE